jgi:hypothetical protein
MPLGKPAGQRCVQLSLDNLCALFGLAERPAVCSAFNADPEVCGDSDQDAVRILGWWEQMTA